MDYKKTNAPLNTQTRDLITKIGRASCRERV